MKLDGFERAFILMLAMLILAYFCKDVCLQEDQESKQNTLQPDTQGNLNTTYQSDSVTTKKYQFKSYSPITETNEKYNVKEIGRN